VVNIVSQNSLGLAEDVLKNRIQKLLAIRNGNHAKRRSLPNVSMVQFRHSNVEPGAETVAELAEDCSFLLE
jgi:hypothetical protein